MRITLLRLSILAMIPGVAALAADWPRFRGPAGDGVAPDVKLSREWPNELKRVWQIPSGAGFSSPTVADGRVFLLEQSEGEEILRCLSAGDGKPLWRHAWKAQYKSGLAGDGPRATPTVDGPRVYAVGSTGILHCLDAAGGKALLTIEFAKTFHFKTPTYGYSASPLVDGDNLILHVGGTDGDSVVAMNKLTGKVKWKSQSDPPGYASPMIVEPSEVMAREGMPRQLIVLTEKGLLSLNPADGSLYWRYPWQTVYEQNIAQPMLVGNRLVITTLTGCVALDLTLENGRPAYRERWKNREFNAHFSCPVAVSGYIFGHHGRTGVMRCMDVATGAIKWSQRIPGRQRSGIVVADGLLLTYTDTGHLIVIEATPEAYRELARYEPAGENWCPPTVANGRLFLRDEKSLQCFELPVRQ